jgi:hypothetical protein
MGIDDISLNILTNIKESQINSEIISIYPNPFTNTTTINFKSEQMNILIKIIDILGNEIKTISFTGNQLILEKAAQIENPFEQALFVMVQLPYLQPFDDVNKRVSRLAANIPLNRRNLAPLSFTEVPNELYVQGLLGVYELNRIELLKDVFLWAYDRSAKQYAAQRQSLGDPDPFRLKYREGIRHLVTEMVTGAMPKNIAIGLIKVTALKLPKEDQAKFVEAVETELMNLHEGNFARYMIRPTEFKAWQAVWNEKIKADS